MIEIRAGAADGMRPGQYLEVEDTKAGRMYKVACPRCGNVLALPNHRLTARGVLVPTVRCPIEGCGLHDAMKLADHPNAMSFAQRLADEAAAEAARRKAFVEARDRAAAEARAREEADAKAALEAQEKAAREAKAAAKPAKKSKGKKE